MRLKTEWENIPRHLQHTPPVNPPHQPPPPANCREFFCDGSFSQNLPRAGYGIIIKDPHGVVVAGYEGTLVCSSPIVAEAQALLLSIRMAVGSGEETSVKTDCLDLVSALKNSSASWPMAPRHVHSPSWEPSSQSLLYPPVL
ncbi:hypothetical protein LINPERHAP2_LOCUS6125 [Linum perenne]